MPSRSLTVPYLELLWRRCIQSGSNAPCSTVWRTLTIVRSTLILTLIGLLIE